MSEKYILALDQGTNSSRAILFNHKQEIVAAAKQEFAQYYPQDGWVEHNPMDILESQLEVARQVVEQAKINGHQIAGIGISNQRETSLIWNKNTGKPVYNAIVWQDKRTAAFCSLLKNQGLTAQIQETTGLIIDSYFSASKIRWILKNVPDARNLAETGNLLFGTVDTWLIWNLTGGKLHITDFSNAARTMLYDIKNLCWDEDLLSLFSIPEEILPRVVPSSQVYGHTIAGMITGASLPIAGVAGDQQAALFGQTCFEPGMAKNTYGTGCFMLMNTGLEPKISHSGLLSTIAWGLDNKVYYAQEGSVFIAGAAVRWLRDGLHMIKNAADTETISEQLDSSEGVYVVPAFSGLGAPYWDMYARGAILGLTQATTEKHLIRATLESLAYQSTELVDLMVRETGLPLKSLNVDGGACANNFLMQFQADLLNAKVVRPANIETTALGAAYLAGLAVGFWNQDDLGKLRRVDRSFNPKMQDETREKLYAGWKKAVQRSLHWAEMDKSGY